MPDIRNPQGISTATAPAARQQALMAAQGIYTETAPRSGAGNNTVPVSGSIYFMAIGLLAGDTVTNLLTFVHTAGTGFSGIGMKVGLYSKAGVLLASSADVSGAHATTGPKVNVLSAPYLVPTTDGYYAALLQVGSANLAIERTIGSGAYSQVLAPGAMGTFGIQTAQTDLTAPATITTSSASSLWFWLGVS